MSNSVTVNIYNTVIQSTDCEVYKSKSFTSKVSQVSDADKTTASRSGCSVIIAVLSVYGLFHHIMF